MGQNEQTIKSGFSGSTTTTVSEYKGERTGKAKFWIRNFSVELGV